MTRRDRRPLIAAVSIALAAKVLGMRWLDALLVGLVAFVLVTVATTLEAGADHPWPPEPPEEPDGARGEVSALTWSFFGRDGRVSEVVVRRLRADAARRLAKHRVILPGGLNSRTATAPENSPEAVARARELLGERAWATLTARGGLMPSILDVAHCVDVLERLAPPGPTVLSEGSNRRSQPRGTTP